MASVIRSLNTFDLVLIGRCVLLVVELFSAELYASKQPTYLPVMAMPLRFVVGGRMLRHCLKYKKVFPVLFVEHADNSN